MLDKNFCDEGGHFDAEAAMTAAEAQLDARKDEAFLKNLEAAARSTFCGR